MNTPAFLLRTFFDNDGDGLPENIVSETYSADDKILNRVFDYDADEQADAVTTYTYNSNGDQTGLFFDAANDGIVDYSFTTDYTTDASGVLTTTSTSSNAISSFTTDYTTDANDVLTATSASINAIFAPSVYVSKFDTAGNLIEEVIEYRNGRSRVATYAYNDLGQITAYDTGSGSRSEYSYDTAGRITGSNHFSNGETTPSSTQNYTYDAAGNLVQQESTFWGLFFSSKTYTYDEENRLVASASDVNNNILADASPVLTQYEYNAAGQITAYAVQVTGGLAPQNVSYAYEYDEFGNFIREVVDTFSYISGASKRISEYGYDGAGRITSQRIDNDADGIFDRTTSYAYDDLLTGRTNEDLVVAGTVIELESNLFSDDFVVDDLMTPVAPGTSDVFSSSELMSRSLLASSTFLESETGMVAAE